MKQLYFAAMAILIGLSCQTQTNAQDRILGLDGNNQIIDIDSGSSLVGVGIGVTGLVGGDTLVGIDFRSATGQMYAIGDQNNVYTLNTNSPTFAATLVGNFADGINDDPTGPGALSGNQFAFDFNPSFTPDPTANAPGSFARIISDTSLNRVINGNNGEYLGAEKTDVFYPVGDANAGAAPNIQGIAYDNSFPSSPGGTQYGIDITQDTLVTVANNAGTLVTVAGLTRDGAAIDVSGDVGFDITGPLGSTVGYVSLTTGALGQSELHTVDLDTGALALVGNFGSGPNTIRSLAVVGPNAIPEPSSLAFLTLGLVGFASRRRRS